MATYQELANISNDASWSGLVDKVKVAVTVKAAAVIDSTTPPATLLDWAKGAIISPGTTALTLVYYIVAKNQAQDIATILAAGDAAIQTNVDAAVDALYGS